MVTVVAGDHDSKSEESIAGDFGAPYCSSFFSCSVLRAPCSVLRAPCSVLVLVLVLEAI